jgi:hypothetical protein
MNDELTILFETCAWGEVESLAQIFPKDLRNDPIKLTDHWIDPSDHFEGVGLK